MWNNIAKIMEVNQTDICLILKVTNPTNVHPFRPISLCNTIYKVLSKIIVNRLKDLIYEIIGPYQMGFIPGRNIQESIVVAQKMLHNMN